MGPLSSLDFVRLPNPAIETNVATSTRNQALKSLPDSPRSHHHRDRAELGATDSTSLDAFVHQSTFERIAIEARLRESVVTMNTGERAEELGFAAQQLEFSFAAEYRSEELALFRQRTSDVAQNLPAGFRDDYLAASQRISARFEASVEVSRVVLTGFANASENLASIDPEALPALTGFADKALQKIDEILNQLFEVLDDLFKSGNSDGFSERFNALLDELFALADTAFEGGVASSDSAVAGIVQLEFNFSFSASIQIEAAVVQQSDPITFDLDGDGVELTSYRDGARFDITGRGFIAQTAFVRGGDAFLALDRNGNGVIDDGSELFGDQRGALNGFEELRKLDSNRDGVIDKNDADYGHLLLFRDNGNGKTEKGELLGLASAGIESISLGYRNTDQAASGGNRIAQIASFRRSDGAHGTVVDSILNFTV